MSSWVINLPTRREITFSNESERAEFYKKICKLDEDMNSVWLHIKRKFKSMPPYYIDILSEEENNHLRKTLCSWQERGKIQIPPNKKCSDCPRVFWTDEKEFDKLLGDRSKPEALKKILLYPEWKWSMGQLDFFREDVIIRTCDIVMD